ncbi:hypothetical protein [Vibrio campbellii]|uniref:Uncharacterized protein n=1 Tax=Vibrio campbellii (strain ATCC BAA-1116) TaxID=2902295 RepID=A7MYK6_VIBC1|nr:hypothetical protein [Vibrio campbellii]ABU70932.1 hypothetical protein VIBHAR_01967 [Vibrio campbellii ATCC BAA-1116]AGU96170.1 hypothetical protein M892_03395 [Vibrio campbellii ATCC BAA-1116]MBT0123015.1 hypothetical protein [Vibrio campbellii]MBT0138066.1 hypothetical protein [Vibrio campbellii]MBT0142788.1 hypothetical protein [Vibrio campbellii]
MEVYSDNKINEGAKRFSILIAFFCFAPFQIGNAFSSEYYIPQLFCWSMFLMTCIVPLYTFSSYGISLINKRVEFGLLGLFYLLFNISMLIMEPVITSSKKIFDINFYMFIILILTYFFGVFFGVFFSNKNKFHNKNHIVVRGDEIELRKVDVFGALSLQRMPFLRAPLKKMRNALYVVAFFVGTGGAGVGMGIAELLKRSDIISPEVGVHSVLFFSLGMPVLFTFGVLTYSMVAYLFEWRKLIAGIEKEFGGHKIIFNSQKKSYKKIKDILDSRE